MPFKVPYAELADRSAAGALQAVREAPMKRLIELRVYDLLRHGDEPILNGVYLFFSPDRECLYVGKNSAQKFVERIPWHFALADDSWMNHYLRRTREHERLGSWTEAAEAAGDDLLLLVPVERGRREAIKPLEKFFRVFAEPRYNALPPARYRDLVLDAPLRDVLTRL